MKKLWNYLARKWWIWKLRWEGYDDSIPDRIPDDLIPERPKDD